MVLTLTLTQTQTLTPILALTIVGVRTNLGRLARERPAQLVGGDRRRAAGGDALRVVELVPA